MELGGFEPPTSLVRSKAVFGTSPPMHGYSEIGPSALNRALRTSRHGEVTRWPLGGEGVEDILDVAVFADRGRGRLSRRSAV
jgi:hypothetical protein